jgi:hypothetical protein
METIPQDTTGDVAAVQACLAADITGARVPVGVATELVVKLQAHNHRHSGHVNP